MSSIALILLCVAAEPSVSLKYVRGEDPESTRRATLAATDLPRPPGRWFVLGPFAGEDGDSLDIEFSPEQGIDLSEEYPGKTGPIRWEEIETPLDGVFDLGERWPEHRTNVVAYLLREVEAEEVQDFHVEVGADDGWKLFVDGQRVANSPGAKAFSPRQRRLSFRLRPERQRILLKVHQVGPHRRVGFAPALPEALEVELTNRLQADFPPTDESRHYRMVRFPIPDPIRLEVGGLAFREDGGLLIGTRRGRIWLLRDPLSESFADFELVEWASGLHEITGLEIHDGVVYVAQRPEITIVEDTDGDDRADRFRTFCDDFGVSGDYHEYVFGPARDSAGRFYVTLNVGFGGGHQSKAPYRGWMIRLEKDGRMTPMASGLRSPNGVGVSPDGRVFYTDNQGEWVASCKLAEVRPGDFHGHPASLRWKADPDSEGKESPTPTPPAVWFPFGKMSQSASQPIWDRTEGDFGPFAGQVFVGEQTKSLVMRVFLEDVGGRSQGVCFHFRRGFECGVNRIAFAPDGSLFAGMTSRGWGSVGGAEFGLARLVYTGSPPFEIHAVRIRDDGFVFEFTEAIDESSATVEAFSAESYEYHYWSTYGSPEIERRPNPVLEVTPGPDDRSVRVTLGALETGRVYALEATGIRSAAGRPLLHPEAYYTVNATPSNRSPRD